MLMTNEWLRGGVYCELPECVVLRALCGVETDTLVVVAKPLRYCGFKSTSPGFQDFTVWNCSVCGYIYSLWDCVDTLVLFKSGETHTEREKKKSEWERAGSLSLGSHGWKLAVCVHWCVMRGETPPLPVGLCFAWRGTQAHRGREARPQLSKQSALYPSARMGVEALWAERFRSSTPGPGQYSAGPGTSEQNRTLCVRANCRNKCDRGFLIFFYFYKRSNLDGCSWALHRRHSHSPDSAYVPGRSALMHLETQQSDKYELFLFPSFISV